MLESLIPYITAPERTLAENVPIIGELTLQVFGPLVATGVILGWIQAIKYAKWRDLDTELLRDYMFWMLVSGFVVAHWVSVIFYFPHQVQQNPWVLLYVWNGLSSVGGFFGAFLGMMVYLKIHRQPVIVYADATIYGLLIGWVFGRSGCSLVHDHPGRVVPEGTFLAVGPWPDGTWRYDLGLLEFFFALTLMLLVYFVIDWKSKRPGWLVGFVVTCYAPFRFALDFFRADKAARGVISTPDARYAGLTPAQWFTVAFLLTGLYLLFVRRSTDADFAYAKESERLEREKQAKESAAKADGDDDAAELDDDEKADTEADEALADEDDEDRPASP